MSTVVLFTGSSVPRVPDTASSVPEVPDTVSSVPEIPDPVSSVPEVPDGAVATAPDALLARLDVRDGAIRATLESWLHGVRCADSLRDALHRRGELARSEVFVTPSGQVVTADSLDWGELRVTCRVNGVVKQDSNTRHMFFKVPRLIAELSAGMTLEAGDVISTGTPEGVGYARTPPEFLKPGDLLETEVQGIGVLRNTIG